MEWNGSRIQKYKGFNFEKDFDLGVGRVGDYACNSFYISYVYCVKNFLYINQLPLVFWTLKLPVFILPQNTKILIYDMVFFFYIFIVRISIHHSAI